MSNHMCVFDACASLMLIVLHGKTKQTCFTDIGWFDWKRLGRLGQLHRISFAPIREWAGCASASWVACLASSHNFLWLSLDRCCIWQVRTTFFGYHWIDVVYIYTHIYILIHIYICYPPKCLPFYIVSSLLLTNLSVIMIKSILILIWF